MSEDLATVGKPPKVEVSASHPLQAQGITVRFGGLVALSDVGVEVPAQSIVGLLGPNGAGKSTLFAVLSGLLRPASGAVQMDGDDVTSATPQARAAGGWPGLSSIRNCSPH